MLVGCWGFRSQDEHQKNNSSSLSPSSYSSPSFSSSSLLFHPFFFLFFPSSMYLTIFCALLWHHMEMQLLYTINIPSALHLTDTRCKPGKKAKKENTIMVSEKTKKIFKKELASKDLPDVSKTMYNTIRTASCFTFALLFP